MDGDLDAQDDAAATFNDHYYSALAETYAEEYDPLHQDDSDEGTYRGSAHRTGWQETPSSTVYIRVSCSLLAFSPLQSSMLTYCVSRLPLSTTISVVL